MITESMQDTFYSNFAVGERNDSCWEYTGKSSSTGYGRLSNGSGWSSVEVVPGRQLPCFASERQEKRGLK